MKGVSMTLPRASLALILSVICPPAPGQEPQQQSGFHEHDGFFLSLSTGVVYAAIDDNLGSVQWDARGWGAGFDVRVGGTIAPQLILSGDFVTTMWGLSSPLPVESQFYGGTLSQSTWGMGLTYYFMPANFFFSGTIGLASLASVKLGDTSDGPSATGLAVIIRAGKEWWVDADWALGIEISFGWSSVKEPAELYTEQLTGYSIGLQFNATYN